MDVSWVHRLNAVTQIRQKLTLITIIKAKQSEIRSNHRSDNFWTSKRYKAPVIFLGRKLVHSLFMALNKFPHHAASVQRNLPAVFSKDQLLGPDLGLVFHVYQACSSVCQLLNALFVLTGLQRLDGQRLRRHDSDLSRFLKKSLPTKEQHVARRVACSRTRGDCRRSALFHSPRLPLPVNDRAPKATCYLPNKTKLFFLTGPKIERTILCSDSSTFGKYYNVLIYQYIVIRPKVGKQFSGLKKNEQH